MPQAVSAQDVLDREFLGLRAGILNVAAALDRLERAGVAADEPRMAKIRASLQTLSGGERARAVQMVFSLPYDDNWRTAYGL